LEITVSGVNPEAFGVLTGQDWFLAGGADTVGPDDGRPKMLEARVGPVDVRMVKGVGHRWTGFCEDAVFICFRRRALIAALFDGVSGHMDGSGGVASRSAAKALLGYVEPILSGSTNAALERYREECSSIITWGATTALILVVPPGGPFTVYSKGDSMCYVDGKLINHLDSVGGVLSRWLNEDSPFNVYVVEPKEDVTLCSDGVLNTWDDLTELKINPKSALSPAT
jgi:hypothetical protein